MVAADPGSPIGIPRFRIAALDVPEFDAVAEDPAGSVVVLPIVRVAALPAGPLAPAGTPKSNTAALLVPLFTTVAGAPGASVLVVPTATVAAAPSAPGAPSGPGHRTKSSKAADVVPEFVTVIAVGPYGT